MIHFTCEHCGRPVRVADVHGGKKGRCPSCHHVVEVPPPEKSANEKASDLEALANAAGAPAGGTAGPDVPPPPQVADVSAADELLEGRADRSGETDILPAEQPGGAGRKPKEYPPGERPRPEPSARWSTRKKVLLAVCILVGLVLAAGLTVLLLSL